MNSLQPLFGLDRHLSSVSAVTVLDAWGSVPVVVTGDASGNCVVWSILTRRELLRFSPEAASRCAYGCSDKQEVDRAEGLQGVMWCAGFGEAIDVDHCRCLRFVTQLRSQKLVAWEMLMGDEESKSEDDETAHAIDLTPRLLASTAVPQFGFCSVAKICSSREEALFAVPTDDATHGTIWLTELVRRSSGWCFERRAALALQADFRGGQLMAMCSGRLQLCWAEEEEREYLSAGFESGHLVLAARKNRAEMKVLSATRCFSEPVMTVAFLGDLRLCCGSADGLIHCYLAAVDAAQVTLTLTWEHRCGVGVGHCAAVDSRILFAGCWDGSLRLLDACGEGNVVTILTSHRASVQMVCCIGPFLEGRPPGGLKEPMDIAPSTLSKPPSFLFAPARRQNGGNGGRRVYGAVSASSDGKVLIWRVEA
jgi:hypothetical protein